MYCQICGTENGAEWRNRSAMRLCRDCHRTTPEKASRETFASVTGLTGNVLAEFYSDYKASRHSSVKEYWEACAE